MEFVKMHGCGNDYILVNENAVKDCNDISKLVRKLSSRTTGIGSDGLIIVGQSKEADLKMTMYNSDGSKGMMCGNGIRLVGKYAYEHKLTIKRNLTVETDSGIRSLKLHTSENGRRVNEVTVNMGAPVFMPEMIPDKFNDRHMICVNMGNLHCICLVDDLDSINAEKEGASIENGMMVPGGINVMFVKVIAPDEISLKVWERGSGVTCACGSGACASFAVCFVKKLCEKMVKVTMPGGEVTVMYDQKTDSVLLRGEAVEVFGGDVLCD